MGIDFEALLDGAQHSTTVHVEEWRGDVELTPLTLSEKARLLDFQAELKQENGELTDREEQFAYIVELAAMSISDAGVRVMDNGRGRAVLSRCRVDTLTKLLAAATELNGLDDAAAAIAEAKKK